MAVEMVRTICCESFKCAARCSSCPHRPENREAVKQFQESMANFSVGRRFRVAAASAAGNSDCSQVIQIEG
jgi:hypothetical protein